MIIWTMLAGSCRHAAGARERLSWAAESRRWNWPKVCAPVECARIICCAAGVTGRTCSTTWNRRSCSIDCGTKGFGFTWKPR